MSFQELYKWYDYYNQEPFLADRLEIQMATICQIVASFGSKNPPKHKDFMITGKKEKPKSHKEFEDGLKNMFMAVGKVLNKEK